MSTPQALGVFAEQLQVNAPILRPLESLAKCSDSHQMFGVGQFAVAHALLRAAFTLM
jgi:hypothetical protein